MPDKVNAPAVSRKIPFHEHLAIQIAFEFLGSSGPGHLKDLEELLKTALSEREEKVAHLMKVAKDELDPCKDIYICQKGVMEWCRCDKCRAERLRAALSALGESK